MCVKELDPPSSNVDTAKRVNVRLRVINDSPAPRLRVPLPMGGGIWVPGGEMQTYYVATITFYAYQYAFYVFKSHTAYSNEYFDMK